MNTELHIRSENYASEEENRRGFGGTTVKIGAVEEQNRISDRITLPMDRSEPFADAVKRIADAVRSIGDVGVMGFGIPSTLMPSSLMIIHANNLGWKQCDIKQELYKYMGETLAYLANDADCAAVGEWMHGAGRGTESMLMLTLGTGIGGSYIQNNKLFLGGNGIGMEPGHMVICPNGRACSCGKRGCLESYAFASALRMEAEASRSSLLQCMVADNGGQGSARMIFDAAAMGNPDANRILDAYIEYLALGISNLISLFGPLRVVIGGGVCAAGNRLFTPLRKAVYDLVDEVEFVGCPEIVPAMLGNDAGIIGAALLDRVVP